MKEIEIILVCAEIGAGTRGASLGPQAIFLEDPKKWGSFSQVLCAKDLSYYQKDTLYKQAKYIDVFSEHIEEVAQKVHHSLEKNHFPLIFSGDHGNALGTLAGIKRMYPKEKIGVIWIDAHADLHSIYTTPSGNIHGMVLGAALAEDNLPDQIQKPDAQTIEYWEKLKNLGQQSPMIDYANLAFIGTRDLEKQEENLIEKHPIFCQNPQVIRQEGISKIAEKTTAYLAHCDKIYISLDVDSLDPSFSKGTGTPVKGGLSDEEISQFLNILLASQKVFALEITEVNPLLDTENKMAKIVNRMLSKLNI